MFESILGIKFPPAALEKLDAIFSSENMSSFRCYRMKDGDTYCPVSSEQYGDIMLTKVNHARPGGHSYMAFRGHDTLFTIEDSGKGSFKNCELKTGSGQRSGRDAVVTMLDHLEGLINPKPSSEMIDLRTLKLPGADLES